MLIWKKERDSMALEVQLVMQSDSCCDTIAESKLVKQCLMHPALASTEYCEARPSKNSDAFLSLVDMLN